MNHSGLARSSRPVERPARTNRRLVVSLSGIIQDFPTTSTTRFARTSCRAGRAAAPQPYRATAQLIATTPTRAGATNATGRGRNVRLTARNAVAVAVYAAPIE